MATASQEPSRLNVTLVRGDAWGLEVDFVDDVSAKTFSGGLYSTVTGLLVKAFTFTTISVPENRINMALSATETANLVPGTYELRVQWTPSDRRVYEGFAEVLP